MNTALRQHDAGARPAVSEPPRPRRVPGAVWQAGVTLNSARFKVLIDGEPAPLCFAARAGDPGWAVCHPEPTLQATRTSTRAPLGLQYLIDAFSDTVVRQGKVEIVPVGGTQARSNGHVRH